MVVSIRIEQPTEQNILKHKTKFLMNIRSQSKILRNQRKTVIIRFLGVIIYKQIQFVFHNRPDC